MTHMPVTSEKWQQCYIDDHRGFLFSFGIWKNLITRCGKEANDEPHPHLPDRFWRPCALSGAISGNLTGVSSFPTCKPVMPFNFRVDQGYHCMVPYS